MENPKINRRSSNLSWAKCWRSHNISLLRTLSKSVLRMQLELNATCWSMKFACSTISELKTSSGSFSDIFIIFFSFSAASKWWWKTSMQTMLYKRWSTCRSPRNAKHCCTRSDHIWILYANTLTASTSLQSWRNFLWNLASALSQRHQAHRQRLQRPPQKLLRHLLALGPFRLMESKIHQ